MQSASMHPESLLAPDGNIFLQVCQAQLCHMDINTDGIAFGGSVCDHQANDFGSSANTMRVNLEGSRMTHRGSCRGQCWYLLKLKLIVR